MSHPRHLPAEWAEQDGILLAWPHVQTDWLPLLPRIEQVYTELVYQITRFEHVVLLCNTTTLLDLVREKLRARGANLARVHGIVMAYDDTWLRDSGPLTVSEGEEMVACDFRFNAWGGKYDARQDDRICYALSQQALFRARYQSLDIILEGGSLDADGEGTLLTTRQCLLTPTRNPGMTPADYEQLFTEQLGAQRVIWLEHGELEGDDTDGHVDMLARFCDPHTIAYTSCERKHDSHYPSLQALANELAGLRTYDGQAYHLVPLPIPEPIHNEEGRRLPASYANFLILNKAVLVPCYQDANDERVLASLQVCFPGREIIGIDARAVIEQNGSLHCLSMQLPRGCLNIRD